MAEYIGWAIMAVLFVLSVIAFWRCFTKAGEKGWKAIIPFYRQYIMFKLAWNTAQFKYWLIPTILSYIFMSGLMFFPEASPIYLVISVLWFIAYIISFVFICKMYIRFALAYGKTAGYGAAMAVCERLLSFLYPVAIVLFMIIAFGKSEYQGPRD